ncbi:MAG: type II toxin-antitoxin system RelE/ParE family toxin [Oscillospiraceae bacterium]|jgi:plasmid stabilization system protein ParE|nr:type II toxin-antitoxin system RelE/ParE family toxin [Oscillospiraceae bacterium]
MRNNETAEYSLRYNARAVGDLARLYWYIALELSAPESAARIVGDIRAACETLRQFPLRAKMIRDARVHRKDWRMLAVGNFRVYYRADTKRLVVYINRIAYNRRDVAPLLNL